MIGVIRLRGPHGKEALTGLRKDETRRAALEISRSEESGPVSWIMKIPMTTLHQIRERARNTGRALPATLVLTALASAASARGVSFTDLGALSGSTYVRASGISADGKVVTGHCEPQDRAFRWTALSGMQSIQSAGITDSFGEACNGDGSVIVGTMHNPNPVGFRWTAATGMQVLPGLPGSASGSPLGVSSSGNVIVGNGSGTSSSPHGVRWTTPGGIQDLGTLPGDTWSEAWGASADGAVAVGKSWVAGRAPRAVRWNSAGNIQDLGVVGGDTESEAYGTNSDGSIVVGESKLYSSFSRAFRWTSSGGMQNLGTLPGAAGAQARSTSADGSVIVGTSGQRAMMWTQSLGMVDLNAYLPTLGIDLSGWVLQGAVGVSADGTTITGYGTRGGTRSWIATIPAPGGVTVAAMVIGVAARRRSR